MQSIIKYIRLISFTLLFLYPNFCIAALSLDDGAFDSGTGATITFNVTNSNTNNVMYACVSFRKTGSEAVSGITFNTTENFSFIGGLTATTAGPTDQHRVELWRLIAPSSGTHAVVVSLSNNNGAVAAAISFSGADQTTPNGTVASNSGESSLPTVDVSSASGDIVIDCVVGSGATNFAPPGSGQSELFLTGNPNGNAVGAMSQETATGATTTMNWTGSSPTDWASLGTAVKAAAGSGAVPHNVQIMWKDNSIDELRFELLRNNRDGPNGNYTLLATLPANTTSYIDSFDPSFANSYCYKVRACNDAGCSDPSNFACEGYPNLPGQVALTIGG